MKAANTDAPIFFGERARVYDDFITRLVPYYHEANRLLIDVTTFERDAPLKVLDIGAGTGAVSEVVLKAFKNARLTCLDASAEMLGEAATRLAPFAERVSFREGRFPEADIGDGWDLVVSTLAYHHLDDGEKAAGFRLIHRALGPGGQLLICDYVAGATPTLDAHYLALWKAWVTAQGHDDLDWFEEHREQDCPASVENQTRWLSEAGFTDVACHWRHLNYAIFGGRKAARAR